LTNQKAGIIKTYFFNQSPPMKNTIESTMDSYAFPLNVTKCYVTRVGLCHAAHTNRGYQFMATERFTIF